MFFIKKISVFSRIFLLVEKTAQKNPRRTRVKDFKTFNQSINGIENKYTILL